MKLSLRILKWAALSITGILIVGFLYFYFIFFGRPAIVAKLDDVHDKEWHTIPFQGNTKCSDGSPFAIFVRKGASKNFLIHFSGGGASWDSITYRQPISLMSGLDGDSRDLKSFYFPSLFKLFPKALGGLVDNEDTKNAFRDWNIIFIPYCTGDMHIGNITNTYSFNGEKYQIHHNGRNNSLAALKWVFANFKKADKIMVSGESSGAWGSAFWTPYIADHYAGKKIYQLSDGALLTSDRWKEILDTVWKSESLKFLGFKISKDAFEDALIHRTDSVNRQIKYLHSNTVYDDVLTRFSAALNHKPTNSNKFINEWSHDTRASMERLRASNLDYNYFISDWGHDTIRHATQHTMTTNEYYHNCTANGISYAEWLKKNVIDDEKLSLGEEFLLKN